MIENLAYSLARKIKYYEGEGSTSNVNIMAYALGGYLNTIIVVLCTLIIGVATNTIMDTLLAIVGFVALRRFSGGFHFTSLDKCAVVSTLIFVVAAHWQLNDTYTYVLTVISLVIAALRAPNFYVGKLTNPRSVRLYKLTSIGIIILNLFLVSGCLSFVFFAQSITLIIPKRGGETHA